MEFLLLLVGGHAQTSPIAPAGWPMRGRNLGHTSTGLVAAPNNSVLVWKYETGEVNFQSPAIGSDGTIYIGGGAEFHAFNADGTIKWTYDTPVRNTPAIGADGTIYASSDSDDTLHAIADLGDRAELKWKVAAGDAIYSSPALATDGASLYFGSHDAHLYAVNTADGSVKWMHQTGSGVFSSPAVAPNGTIYVGSWDSTLHAVTDAGDHADVKWIDGGVGHEYLGIGGWSSPALGTDGTVYVGGSTGLFAVTPEGVVKWVHKTPPLCGEGECTEVQSSPAVGADGTIYVGFCDNTLHAVTDEGDHAVVQWTYGTGGSVNCTADPRGGGGAGGSSPAVGADGTVYIGSTANILHAVTPQGDKKWTYETGDWVRSSPAVGADGTIAIGSQDGFFYVFGLSASHVTSRLHLAQRALARNQSATPQLDSLCNFTYFTHWAPQCNATLVCNVCPACCNTYLTPEQCPLCFAQDCSPRYDTTTAETVNLVDFSCQLLNNANSSAAYLKAWEGYLDTSLSFKYYQDRISSGGTMMTLLQTYEHQYTHFMDRSTTLDDRIADAKTAVAGIAADETNWRSRINTDTTAMNAYGKEVHLISTSVARLSQSSLCAFAVFRS